MVKKENTPPSSFPLPPWKKKNKPQTNPNKEKFFYPDRFQFSDTSHFFHSMKWGNQS